MMINIDSSSMVVRPHHIVHIDPKGLRKTSHHYHTNVAKLAMLYAPGGRLGHTRMMTQLVLRPALALSGLQYTPS